VFGGAREVIFGKLVGGSLTVEVAGIIVMSTLVGILEGAGILVVWSSPAGIVEGAGILVVWSSLVGIVEGAGIRVGHKLELTPGLVGTTEVREDLPSCGIDEGPADGAVERMSFRKSFLDDIVDLFYGGSKNVEREEEKVETRRNSQSLNRPSLTSCYFLNHENVIFTGSQTIVSNCQHRRQCSTISNH
jgi:hypothetical protein